MLLFSCSSLSAAINSKLLKSNRYYYYHYYHLSFLLNNVSNIFLLTVLFVSIYIKDSIGGTLSNSGSVSAFCW